MNTIKYGVLVILLLAWNVNIGQSSFEEVVYLKNGSIIRGVIVEQVPNQTIKIQTRDNNILVYKVEEIEKITKEVMSNSNAASNRKYEEFKVKGYINITELSYCRGMGSYEYRRFTYDNEDQSYGLRSVNGYQVNENLSFGIGLGIDKYEEVTLVPVTFDVRVNIVKGRFSPVFNANVGYAVGLDNIEGGLVINPAFGLRTYISEKTAFVFNLGYKWQTQTLSTTYGYNNTYSEEVVYQFISVSTGFLF